MRQTLQRMSRLTSIILTILVLIDTGIDMPRMSMTVINLRLIAVWILVLITYRISLRFPHQWGASLFIGALYLGFLVFPGLIPNVNPSEHLLLTIFLTLLITILPYLLFDFGKDQKWLWSWQLICISTFIWSFWRVLPHLEQTEYARLPQAISSRPMVMIGFLGVFVIIQLVILQFKRIHYQQKRALLYTQEELNRSITLSKIQNQALERQEEELQQADLSLRETNQVLEGKVNARTHQLKSQNEQLIHYNYMYSHLMRAPMATLSGLLHLEEIEEDPGAKAHMQLLIAKEFSELEAVATSVTELLNDQDHPLYQTVREKLAKKYGSADEIPLWKNLRTK